MAKLDAETEALVAGVGATGFDPGGIRAALEATAPTTLCTAHLRAPGTNNCERCGRPIQVPQQGTMRDRAREFVVGAFLAVDGKAPSEPNIERAVELICVAFAPEEPIAGAGAFGDPFRLDPLWEARLGAMAKEAGVRPRAYLIDLIRERWTRCRG